MIPTSLNSIVQKIINTNKKFEIKEQSVLLHFPYIKSKGRIPASQHIYIQMQAYTSNQRNVKQKPKKVNHNLCSNLNFILNLQIVFKGILNRSIPFQKSCRS